jgi:nucleolar pre-ribosomal-associated protein 1
VPLAGAAELLLPLRRRALREAGLLDARRCLLAAAFFPEARSLAGGEQQALPRGAAPGYVAGALAAADPALLLPLAAANLRAGCLDVPALLHAGLLPLCLRALAARDGALRALAYETLGLFMAALEACEARDKPALSALLAHVRNAVTRPFQRLPAVSAAFAAEASLALCHPGCAMFRAVQRAVAARPALDLADVPLLRKLLTPGGPRAAAEQVWLLRLMWAGLRGAADWRVYQRRHALELLMAAYRCQGSGPDADRLVLHVLRQAAALPGLAARLVQTSGLLAWLAGVAARGRGGDAALAVETVRQLLGCGEGGEGGGGVAAARRQCLAALEQQGLGLVEVAEQAAAAGLEVAAGAGTQRLLAALCCAGP